MEKPLNVVKLSFLYHRKMTRFPSFFKRYCNDRSSPKMPLSVQGLSIYQGFSTHPLPRCKPLITFGTPPLIHRVERFQNCMAENLWGCSAGRVYTGRAALRGFFGMDTFESIFVLRQKLVFLLELMCSLRRFSTVAIQAEIIVLVWIKSTSIPKFYSFYFHYDNLWI